MLKNAWLVVFYFVLIIVKINRMAKMPNRKVEDNSLYYLGLIYNTTVTAKLLNNAFHA